MLGLGTVALDGFALDPVIFVKGVWMCEVTILLELFSFWGFEMNSGFDPEFLFDLLLEGFYLLCS